MLIISEHVDIHTPTGEMRTYIHRPKNTSKVPVILFYSEIFQQTGPIERAAKIIASHGYAVLVSEVFHELNPIGTILEYDDAGREKGNADKAAKNVKSYDSDNTAMIEWAKKQNWCNGNFGAMGFCIGGHLAFRAALNKDIKSLYINDMEGKSKAFKNINFQSNFSVKTASCSSIRIGSFSFLHSCHNNQ